MKKLTVFVFFLFSLIVLQQTIAQNDNMSKMKNDMSKMQNDASKMEKDASMMHNDMSKMKEDMSMTYNNFSKDELIKVLNNFDSADLDITNKQSKALKKHNKSLVNNISNIISSGGKSVEDKKSALRTLKKDSTDKLMNLLGEETYKNYERKLKKQLQPYKQKLKLAGLAL